MSIGSVAHTEQWAVPDPQQLAWAHWDVDCSLFHAGTGMTHLLNEFPAEILRRLCAEPFTTAGLARALAEDCDVVCDAEWEQTVSRTLVNLHALDLIDRVAG